MNMHKHTALLTAQTGKQERLITHRQKHAIAHTHRHTDKYVLPAGSIIHRYQKIGYSTLLPLEPKSMLNICT